VFQVYAPGLASDFPPIRSLDAFPGNLPVQLSSFVGRHDELVKLAGTLREARLVTVTGTGGVGKTRLAVQLAAEILQRFPDGAWLCELAAASDGESMVMVVTAALAVEPRAGVPLVESVVEFLRNKQALVILDNCEHVLDAVARLADGMLRRCPGIRLVATSREGLGVDGERIWPLQSLPVTADPGSPSGLGDAPSLFVERVRAAHPDFVAEVSDAAAIVEVCRRLDGIPLAIELAAARAGSMSPAQIAHRLDERFRLLTGGRRTAVERHQTLRAAVDWSYSMLDEREQTVFNRLGVFSGSFDDGAAESVVTGDGIEAWDVVDALDDLVAKSLVTAERSHGTTRYQMLETMRAYAREQLDATDDADTWRRRHAEYYAKFAEAAGPAVRGPDERVWRARLGEELDNLRAAVIWGLDADADSDAELALRIIANLAWESIFDRASGVGAWAQRALPRLANAPAGLRVAVLGAAAGYSSFSGDHEAARPLALAAIEEWQAPGCPAPSLPHVALVVVESYLGRPDEALRLSLESQRLFADADPWTRAGLAATGAASASYVGNYAVAVEQAEEAVRCARLAGHPSHLATALFTYGLVFALTDDEASRRALEEGIELIRPGASAVGAGTFALLAMLRARSGERRGALTALRRSIVMSSGVADRVSLGESVCMAEITLGTFGHHEAVAVLFGAHSSGAVVALGGSTRQRDEEMRTAERARTALGDTRADELARRGASMSYDDVVEYLLSVINELLVDADHE
jgi:predicted ATPase